MQFTTTVTVLLSALATTAMAGNAIVVNNCQAPLFLTITRSNQQSSTRQIPARQRYSEPIRGQGNSFGITRNQNYYSPQTPKLIWGFSDVPPTLYYSVSAVDGNPFAGQRFAVTSSDGRCGAITGLDGRTRTCGDNNDFTLTLC